MSAKLYVVTVSHHVFVVATSPGDAERWARSNVTEWGNEPLREVSATEATPGAVRGTRGAAQSLPWCVDCPDDAMGRTCAEWVDPTRTP